MMLNPFYGEMNDDACYPGTAPASDRVQFDHQCSRSLGFVCPLPLVVCAVCVLQRSTAPSRPRRSTNECARSETSISDECRETRSNRHPFPVRLDSARRSAGCGLAAVGCAAAPGVARRPLRRTATRPRAVISLAHCSTSIHSLVRVPLYNHSTAHAHCSSSPTVQPVCVSLSPSCMQRPNSELT